MSECHKLFILHKKLGSPPPPLKAFEAKSEVTTASTDTRILKGFRRHCPWWAALLRGPAGNGMCPVSGTLLSPLYSLNASIYTSRVPVCWEKHSHTFSSVSFLQPVLYYMWPRLSVVQLTFSFLLYSGAKAVHVLYKLYFEFWWFLGLVTCRIILFHSAGHGQWIAPSVLPLSHDPLPCTVLLSRGVQLTGGLNVFLTWDIFK